MSIVLAADPDSQNRPIQQELAQVSLREKGIAGGAWRLATQNARLSLSRRGQPGLVFGLLDFKVLPLLEKPDGARKRSLLRLDILELSISPLALGNLAESTSL